MPEYTVELSTSITEIAISKINIPLDQKPHHYMRGVAESWMDINREPRWFECDDICHCSGPILDSKLRIMVSLSGKKIDTFKACDCIEQFKVTRAFSLSPAEKSVGHIMGMSISDGAQRFRIKLDDYDRSKLEFQTSKIKSLSGPRGLTYCEAYIVTDLKNAENDGHDSLGDSEYVLTGCIPSTTPINLDYNQKFSSAFRKEFL